MIRSHYYLCQRDYTVCDINDGSFVKWPLYICDETGESTVTLFSDFMLSIENDACCILLSI